MITAPQQNFARDGELGWYVVNTHSRHEAKVEWTLQGHGLEVFLPRIMVRSRRRDRVQYIEIPLFSGYLFVHTDLNPQAYDTIIRHHGVVRILGFKGQCIPVPDQTQFWPVATFRQTISGLPSLLKSPTPTICQFASATVGNHPSETCVAPFMNQTTFWPVTFMNGVTQTGVDWLPSVADLNWQIVGVGDMNSDVYPDLIWRNTSTGDNSVWFMKGPNQTGSAMLPPLTDQHWQFQGRH